MNWDLIGLGSLAIILIIIFRFIFSNSVKTEEKDESGKSAPSNTCCRCFRKFNPENPDAGNGYCRNCWHAVRA